MEAQKYEYIVKLKNTLTKKTLVAIACIAVIAVTAIIYINMVGQSLNEYETIAYQDAAQMKSMMKAPDSFKLNDIYLLKVFKEDPSDEYTLTVIDFSGTNTFGGVTRDTALFKDGEFLLTRSSDPDDDSWENAFIRLDFEIYLASDESKKAEKWQKIEINTDKIMKKLSD